MLSYTDGFSNRLTGIPLMSAFGNELRRRRKKAKLSLDELADLSGVSKTYIANIENDKPHNVTGKRPEPGKEIVDRLAAALDWSVVAARELAFLSDVVRPRHETRTEDADPALDEVKAMQGRVLDNLPTGRARERYLAKLRAAAEADLEMVEARLAQEEGADNQGLEQ